MSRHIPLLAGYRWGKRRRRGGGGWGGQHDDVLCLWYLACSAQKLTLTPHCVHTYAMFFPSSSLTFFCCSSGRVPLDGHYVADGGDVRLGPVLRAGGVGSHLLAPVPRQSRQRSEYLTSTSTSRSIARSKQTLACTYIQQTYIIIKCMINMCKYTWMATRFRMSEHIKQSSKATRLTHFSSQHLAGPPKSARLLIIVAG